MTLRWERRDGLIALGLILACLVLLFLMAISARGAVLPRNTLTRLEARPSVHGCQYGIVVTALRAPRGVRQVWDFSLGDPLNDIGVRAYHDSYAMYVRLGMDTAHLRCVQLP